MVAEVEVFTCAICEREVGGDRWARKHGRDRHVAPVCKNCEGGVGRYNGYTSHARSVPTIGHGAFMDRRIAYQIAALAEALEIEVSRQNWGQRYG